MEHDFQIVIGLLQELVAGMNRLETRVGGLEARVGGVEERVGGLEGRMAAVEARLDRHERYFELIQAELLAVGERLTRVDHAVASLEGRVGTLESRLTAVEAGQQTLRIELRERFEGTDGRLRVLTDGFHFLEGRTANQLAPLEPRLSALEQQMRSTQEQLGRMEAANVHFGLRIETLGEDVRQRFRALHERLANVA